MEKIAVVTGGGSGLGYCLSEELLKQGIGVLIIGRQENKLYEAQKKLSKIYGEKVHYMVGDVSDESFVTKLYLELAKDNYYVQYLFNCAGTGRFGPAEENNRKKIDVAFEASLIGLILMSSNAIKSMKDDGGIIVNIMSTAALKGNPNESVYCAAKWGARGFTEAIKAATKGTKIKVLGVYPGGMNTDFWSSECGMAPDVTKFMNPEEVAEEIVHAVLEKKSMYVSDLTIDRR